jgi:K+-sensing histidine kinase KdpD
MNKPQSSHPVREDSSLTALQQELATAMQTVEQLQEVRKSMHLFWYIMFNYEVGTPLSTILGFTDLLLSDKDGPSLTKEQTEYLTIIRKKAKEIAQARRQALDLIRFDEYIAGFCDDLHLDEIDLEKVVFDIGEFPETDVQIDLADNLPKVKASLRMLVCILTNTISALRQGGQKNRITINVSYADEQVVVKVANADFVVPEFTLKEFASAEQMPTVFGTSYLAACRCLIDMQGGEMHLDTQEKGGTTVTFTLPVSV